jgi:hypothetical protein
MLGTTDSNLYTSSTENGLYVTPTGQIRNSVGAVAAYLNRTGNDGDIVSFRKDGTEVGSIAYQSHGFQVNGETNHSGISFDAFAHVPLRNATRADNTVSLGTSSYRFKDLYLSGTVNTESVSTNTLDLQAIAESKSDTAVDIFVYDTSKDSDGGAWRHRTQNTSWYNETLNTSTRGATKKFPAVAVLVHTGNIIRIYDGDDPAMPLWAQYADLTHNSGYAASVTARDGSIFGSQRDSIFNYSGNGWYQLNFVADYFFSNIVGVFGSYKQGRHDSLLTSNNFTSLGDRTTALYAGPSSDLAVNDLAVTVLPNAPIDADTGLPVPTIAVATHGGISIIENNGVVYNYTGRTQIKQIKWLDHQHLRFSCATTNYRYALMEYSNGTFNLLAEEGKFSTSVKPVLHYYNNGTGSAAIIDDHTIATYIRNDTGQHLGIRRWDSFDSITTTLGCEIDTDYTTGWMPGDIKLATLSDTDTTNVTGSELVTNGTFDSNVNGWTVNSNGTATSTNGQLVLTNTVADRTRLDTTVTTEVGKTYVFSYEGVSGANFAHVDNIHFNIGLGTAGVHSLTFEARYTSTAIQLGVSTTGIGNTATFDNISVRLAEEDRSVNRNGLQVFGTVTKTAVATGADLVAYSGFSSSNYLQQPYNSDLDFGTGDFCVMGWFKAPATTGHRRLIQYGDASGGTFQGDGQWQLRIDSGTSNLYFVSSANNYSAFDHMSSGFAVDDNTWRFATLVRQSGVVYMYVNGGLSASLASNRNLNNTSGTVMLGIGQDFALPNTDGSLALWRISATAPTAEQIAKIYNDEKRLFQENAKATLYGTSDAVTALAYDDDTELLHAGTSSGRSVFQGLRRVDNTTDAVGAAISASNGLVAED